MCLSSRAATSRPVRCCSNCRRHNIRPRCRRLRRSWISAKAALQNAQLAYQRAAQLAKQGFEAQSNLDQATATRDQDSAQVLAAQANLAQAALNLSYCTIVSPIDGRIGAVTLTKGNLVTPSTPALATVNQLDPIRVVFSVSDNVLVNVQQQTGANQNQIASQVVVNLKLPDGKEYNQTGKISFLNNEVDPQTGTVSVYADFANPQRLLLPGAFVTVSAKRATPQERPVVPVAAVQTEQKGSYVLVVGPDDKVKQQPVTLGRQIAQDYIIEKGLTGGENVIVEGVQKVRPGETVKVTVQQPTGTDYDRAGGGRLGRACFPASLFIARSSRSSFPSS